MVFAGVENNPYFQSTSGFIGNIAYIEIGLFYTMKLEALWTNMTDISSYYYNGILRDFYFENLTNEEELLSEGN